MEPLLQGCCDATSEVWSSADDDAEALIQKATHFVVVLTEDSVKPGKVSLQHLQLAMETKRPMEFIFKPPFFEEHKKHAPPEVQDLLNNREALQHRELEYETEVVLAEVVTRLTGKAIGPHQTANQGVPSPDHQHESNGQQRSLVPVNRQQRRPLTFNGLVNWMREQMTLPEHILDDPLLQNSASLDLSGARALVSLPAGSFVPQCDSSCLCRPCIFA